MATTSYPTSSETDDNADLQELALKSYRNDDLVDVFDSWLPPPRVSVEGVVLRGAYLREQKPRVGPRAACGAGTVGLRIAPETRRSYRKNPREHKDSRTKLCTCSLRSSSRTLLPDRYQAGTVSVPPAAAAGRSGARRCPLRIAELAVPSKRHCLETWRNKWDSLPGLMIHRLKQYVMDERPIHSPDAINCFKMRRNTTKRRNKNSGPVAPQKPCKYVEQRAMEIRTLCAAFGHSIAKKLLRPQKLTLNSDLDRVSQVVFHEITRIMTKQKMICIDDDTNNKILKEMSDKVAVWIATILEDSSDKLLEEDLKVKKYNEKKMGKEGQMLTLIGRQQLLLQHHRGASELEEEEGPVLDFMDLLVDNVMNTCHIDSVSDDDLLNMDNMEKISEKKYEDSTQYETASAYGTGDSAKLQETEEYLTEIPAVTDVKEYLRKEIEHVVYNFGNDIKENDQSAESLEKNTNESIVNETTMQSANIDVNDDNNEAKTSNSDDDEVKTTLFVDNILQIEGHEDEFTNFVNTMINPANAGVNEVFTVLDEDSPDERTKSVKFSNLDMDNARKSTTELSNFSDGMPLTESVTHFIDQEYKDLRKGIRKRSMQRIVFAPPNNYLLCDADESWPDDVSTPALKMTASVSKSITSLGNILENEEAASSPPDHDHTFNEDAKTVHLFEESVNVINPDSSKSTDQTTQSDRNMFHDTQNLLQGARIFSSRKYFEDVGKGDNTDVDEKNVILEAVQQKMNNYRAPLPKFDYRVNLNSAPSWVRSQTSEDSFIATCGRRRTVSKNKSKIKQCDVRKWCLDLQHTFVTLERWHSWLDSACQKITLLKQKTEINQQFPLQAKKEYLKSWINLKKFIDKDAILWTKLNQRVQEKLKLMNSSKNTKIVSTEYCLKCNCKNYSGRNPASEYVTYIPLYHQDTIHPGCPKNGHRISNKNNTSKFVTVPYTS